MAVVLVTGMSGTGTSAALAEFARRGHRAVDSDYGGYAEEARSSDGGGWEQLWREDRIVELLDQHDEGSTLRHRVRGLPIPDGRHAARLREPDRCAGFDSSAAGIGLAATEPVKEAVWPR